MGRPNKIFKIGDIVRYRKGNTALMIIESIYDFGGNIGNRFFGMHCCGGNHAAYESDCVPITENDKETWHSYCSDRKSSYEIHGNSKQG